MKTTIQKYYAFTDGIHKSNNFLDICSKQKSLTFNKAFLDPKYGAKNKNITLPFDEITWVLDYGIGEGGEEIKNYDILLKAYLDAFYNVLKDIKPDVTYVCLLTSGMDSRIVVGTLYKLKLEGFSDFDNIHFRYFGLGESKTFLELMKFCGWKNYEVVSPADDIYGLGNPDLSVGGWCSYSNQYGNFDGFDCKEVVLMGGVMGEVFVKDFPQWYLKGGWLSNRGESLNNALCRFKDVFFPMLDYRVLSVVNATPKKHKNVPAGRFRRDKLRADLVTELGFDRFSVLPVQPNFCISANRRKQMIDQYYRSEFYRRYKIVADFFPNRINYGFGPKVWGFGVTVYEKLYQKGITING